MFLCFLLSYGTSQMQFLLPPHSQPPACPRSTPLFSFPKGLPRITTKHSVTRHNKTRHWHSYQSWIFKHIQCVACYYRILIRLYRRCWCKVLMAETFLFLFIIMIGYGIQTIGTLGRDLLVGLIKVRRPTQMWLASSSGNPDKKRWKRETLLLPACLHSWTQVHLFHCCLAVLRH